MADEKIIFSMNGVGKVLPHNNKVILKDIYLLLWGQDRHHRPERIR